MKTKQIIPILFRMNYITIVKRINFFSLFTIFWVIWTLATAPSCIIDKGTENSQVFEQTVSENDFVDPPHAAKPWVYYWWLKGNVTKELITRDLEEMHKKGIGGFLLFDSRGYHDDYYGRTGHIPVPLQIKYEFMSPEWRDMVKYTMQEANRLGLKMSINLANTGGSLRGPWDMKENGPKQLIWTVTTVLGPQKVTFQLETPSDKKYFQDVALMAAKIKSGEKFPEKTAGLNQDWKTVSAPAEDAVVAGEIVDLKEKIVGSVLHWDVPEGEWRIIRFGYHVIGKEGDVDILNTEAVTKYFHLMGSEILKDAGPLAGETLTHFYNVSWEGGQPDWTVNFENEFKKYRGYDMAQYMPVLAGMSIEDRSLNERFLHDYFRTVSDCFRHNCYETIGELCHENEIQWHSENGGPWPRNAPMFKEADQLAFWGTNDMPQGEFWCDSPDILHKKSNVRYTAMAAHTYGRLLIATEAFTHMTNHWTKYPAYLKPFADINFIDGANFFIWHTFTASPLEVGKPGYEYFAGTHINPNVTWWDKSDSFFDYLGRCQYMLRKGNFVADVCCYVSDKNYVTWGRGEEWNEGSSLTPVKGFSYDLLTSEVLVNHLSVKDGKLVLPDGMSYKMLVVDLTEPVIPVDVLKKVSKLIKDGATVVLGKTKPTRSPGISNYPDCDKEISRLADELWPQGDELLPVRTLGKGKIHFGENMQEILERNNILPDFEGPFEYIHRSGGNLDIYFVAGEGKAECTFRVKGKNPQIWNPVSGKVTDALSYRLTSDGRTAVQLDLTENSSAFIVFREEAEKHHIVSVAGPENPEIVEKGKDSYKFTFWENGDYTFSFSDGDMKKIAVTVIPPIEITGAWNVTFVPATGTKKLESVFEHLTLWNENPNPAIKYFSGTAIYSKSFTLDKRQSESPACLQLDEIHDICRVWVNGRDMGIVWTAPWRINLTGILKEGANDLKIEVTNCWANRLIGDAGLPESKWTTKTNVRRVPDRSEYKYGHQAFSATDKLIPSGLVGPVVIEFGQEQSFTLK